MGTLGMREILPADYPSQLREIPEPPQKLWSLGVLPAEGTKLLAVVGSRSLTSYGREACEARIRLMATSMNEASLNAVP